MPRKKPRSLPPPPEIRPTAVYTLQEAADTLGVSPDHLEAEYRQGRLRHAKRANLVRFLGAWLLAWVEAGEVKQKGTGPSSDQSPGRGQGTA